MAFGIGRIVKAVEDLSVQISGISTDLNTAVAQSGADLGTELADIRRISEANSRELAAVRREIAEVCALVESRCAEPAGPGGGAAVLAAHAVPDAVRPSFDGPLEPPYDSPADYPASSPHDAPPGSAVDLSDDHPHHDLLAHAAGVARAELVCHADTWAFIAEQASRGEHFRMPAGCTAGSTAGACDGIVELTFSGRTLIAIADALWEVTQSPDTSPGTHHLAAQIYNRFHAAVADIAPHGTGAPVRIVIDDRAPADPSPEPPTERDPVDSPAG